MSKKKPRGMLWFIRQGQQRQNEKIDYRALYAEIWMRGLARCDPKVQLDGRLMSIYSLLTDGNIFVSTP